MVTLNLDMPKQKTSQFLFIGTVLYIGSNYINYINQPREHLADAGIYLSGATIFISLIAQCVNWWIYWGKKDKVDLGKKDKQADLVTQSFKVEEIKVILSGKEK